MSERIEFRLHMSSTASWDGRWSGDGRNYLKVETLPDKVAARLLAETPNRMWFHRWDDGWEVCIQARVMAPGERAAKSDGFYGYDWMVRNILAYGSPYTTGTSDGMAPATTQGPREQAPTP